MVPNGEVRIQHDNHASLTVNDEILHNLLNLDILSSNFEKLPNYYNCQKCP